MFGKCPFCNEEAILNFHRKIIKCDTCLLGHRFPHLKSSYEDDEREPKVTGEYLSKDAICPSRSFKGHKESLYGKSPICGLCSRWIKRIEDANIDHILPRSLGGSNHKSNLQLAHRKCNSIKGCNYWTRLPKHLIP